MAYLYTSYNISEQQSMKKHIVLRAIGSSGRLARNPEDSIIIFKSRKILNLSKSSMEFKSIFLLFCLCLIQGFASATLDIKQDETDAGYFHWSSAKRFAEDANTVRNALPSLARQAYEEMRDDARNKGLPEGQTPSAMAALAVGSDVYFSSGLIGRPYLVHPGEVQNYIQEGVAKEVELAIFRCQQTYQSEHRYDMRCAEPIATQQYLVNNPDRSIVGQGKISTYGILNKNDVTNTGILNPCESRYGRWGCQVFIDKLQITRVGNQGDKPGLPSIQPSQGLEHCFWT
ncbi:hypothetical protein EJ05DRAFT_512696 [Pseudovirgaria hyperparasitica]|uniref:Uncharacterized protein n=1 Tax=Pseudovirgaria hyperparasitica TaxID=470096 RepID=A0A6A6W206_9PEZI|nr:uncharacterized protein EJ05DRAFT_512696 [Pseudovirgaria hyperparasitica]KAF2756149.1 hypothetical protein EJ05DRAFT_512696 [Pseudovirgaria hyperparasitica]